MFFNCSRVSKFIAVSFTVLFAACGVQEADDAVSNNGSVLSIDATEDCVGLNHNTAQVRYLNGRYKIVDGSRLLFDFPNRVEADKALSILKAYKIKHSCFVGRPGPSMQYVLTEREIAPIGNLVASEDCVTFENEAAQVRLIGGRYKIVERNKWLLDFGSSRSEAEKSLRLIKKHKFNSQCFVGRPDPSFVYWKRRLPIIIRPIE